MSFDFCPRERKHNPFFVTFCLYVLWIGILPSIMMLQSHYVVLLCSFKEQLQHHVCVHAMEAITACWEIEQSLQSLTGNIPNLFFFFLLSSSFICVLILWLCLLSGL